MSESKSAKNAKGRRRFWKKKRWWACFLLLGGLVWLDGPGWRWIAHRAAGHFLPKLGYEAGFTFDGRLSSGSIGISDLRLKSGSTVQLASLENLRIGYRLGRILRGEIDSLELDGLVAEIDLAATPASETSDDREPAEPTDPAELLAKLRERLVPMKLRVRDLRATIRRGSETLVSVEPTSFRHEPGSETFRFDLGAITLPGDRVLPAQQTRIDWQPDRLVLDRLDLLEEVAVVSLEATIGETLRLRTGLEIADTRFDLATDLDQASLLLTRGKLSAEDVRRIAEIDLPLEATVSGLEIHAAELAGGLETLTASASLAIDRVDFDGWIGDDLTLDATLAADGATTATLEGAILGSPFALAADAVLDRTSSLTPRSARATLTSPRLQPVLTAVRDRFTPSDDAPPPPAASLRLTAETTFDQGTPGDATATLGLVGSEDAPPLSLDARWENSDTLAARLSVPGAEIDGSFTFGDPRYDATAALDGFVPDSLAPWLAPFGIDLPAGLTASLDWQGGGDLEAATHRGELEVRQASWIRDGDQPPLEATAAGRYTWPESVTLDSLEIQSGSQKIASSLTLADRVLSLTKLGWSDGDDTLATGSASIPVPEDPADWKALLRETRPIRLDLKTPDLPLSKLHPFLPEDLRFPDESRARLEIDLAGTPAAPELVAKLRATSLGLTSQPEIPNADLEIDAVGRGQTLKIDGAVLTTDYPPANLSLVTRWDPDGWAEDPETVKTAKIDASCSIRDLNLASFATLLPDARLLEGRVNAEVEIGGTVGAPEPRATLTLDDARLRMKDDSMPRISNGVARIRATPDRVTIENLGAEISGGTVRLGGTVGLDEWRPTTLDLRLDADSLPARRDDSMIVRISSTLTLTGPWETARLRGDLRVVDSLFFKDIEILPIGEPMTRVAEASLPAIDAPPPAELANRIPEPFVNWGLDIALKTPAPFLIRGNLATGEIYLDARLGGTLGNPRPSGEAILREIVAELPFSTLEIKSGKIRLRPNHPFDPVLDIRGTSRIRPYDITIYIYGPISSPQIQPTSSPPLPETEIMTLIATGATTSGLEDPAAATARATQLLIEEARRGRIGAVRVLRPVFSVLDKVDFQVGETDAYTSRKFNSVSFDLDDNWELSAGLSEEGNTRTKVTYLFRFR